MKCKIKNCNSISHRRGFCSVHYRRGLRDGSLERLTQDVCVVCGKNAISKNFCTRHYQQNKSGVIRRTNKSGVVGVCWLNRDKRWFSFICQNRKTIYLGKFKNFEEAVKVRKEAEIKYFGEVIKR